MNVVEYKKRKNIDLFNNFKKVFNCTTVQNYIPIYNKFFSLNETNYNSINFNQSQYYIQDIKYGKKNKQLKETDPYETIYKCGLMDKYEDRVEKNVFFKMAPLLDPYKFLIGKYNVNDTSMYNLPKFNDIMDTSVYPKLKDENNSSYVDGVFSYLSSKLITEINFIHGVDYYGSFLAIKKDFRFNIADDLEYLCQSEFFKQNKNVAFMVDDYDFLINGEESSRALKPLNIAPDGHGSDKSFLSVQSINEDLYEELFVSTTITTTPTQITTLDDLSEGLVDITHSSFFTDLVDKSTTIKSNSTCSSRTSHTSNSDTGDEEENKLNKLGSDNEDEDEERKKGGGESKFNSSNNSDSESSGSYGSDIKINVTIPQFPINIICMEHCKDTFDSLIVEDKLTQEEWFSALMQIIMILITYQKYFSFTHNDLHTNNVMYNTTDLKYIYYCYDKKYYRVPTFGRIYKIIDFGRAIYKYNNKLFCSDSFQNGSDAATQYNTEPYLNEKKPRLEPNSSFDLCRLACSIFDYVIDDLDDINEPGKCSPVAKLINEWCLDDNSLNILYKQNGDERYPEFKLYKMIARQVHNHIPERQLERKEFKTYLFDKKKILNNKNIRVINI